MLKAIAREGVTLQVTLAKCMAMHDGPPNGSRRLAILMVCERGNSSRALRLRISEIIGVMILKSSIFCQSISGMSA